MPVAAFQIFGDQLTKALIFGDLAACHAVIDLAPAAGAGGSRSTSAPKTGAQNAET